MELIIMFLYYLTSTFFGLTSCEVYSAVTDLEELFYTEGVLLDYMEMYITKTEQKLIKLKKYFAEFNLEHIQMGRGIGEYVSNPVNAYLITKRLTSDWKEVEAMLTDRIGLEIARNLKTAKNENLLLFPTEDDLRGAAEGVTRLQRVYNLKTSSLAKGEVNGVQCGTRFSASDCFQLGKQTSAIGDFNSSCSWLGEAMHRYHEEVNKTVHLSYVLEYLAYSSYMAGNIERALKVTNKILEMEPNHKRAIDNQLFYQFELEQSIKNSSLREAFVENDWDEKTRREVWERTQYEKLCRQEVTLSEKVKAGLKCSYVDYGRPFLKLAKLKEEEVCLEPRIVVYHDVIYDREIEVIQDYTIPRLERATVENSQTGVGDVVPFRISKVGFLADFEHPRIAAVSRRVEDITGLSIDTAEFLQVVNYGIGGHYEPHYDFSLLKDSEDLEFLESGRRIATVLFYMSDVSEGGATVFPRINVTLWPKKGSAALWYNLIKNGEGDYRMRHGACPVLVGSKWICTKWLHERGQEFRRPCGLTENES